MRARRGSTGRQAAHRPCPSCRQPSRKPHSPSRRADEMDRGFSKTNQYAHCGACLLTIIHSPVPSQYNTLMSRRLLLVKTNNAPRRTSSCRRSATSAWSVFIPARMSMGSSATKTFRLPAKLSMAQRGLAAGAPAAPPARSCSTSRARRPAATPPKPAPPAD